MTNEEKKQIEFEIRHIFESGANEIRIYDMVIRLIEKTEVANKIFVKPVVSGQFCQFGCQLRDGIWYAENGHRCASAGGQNCH